jgi:hypothetical protein
MLFYLKITHNLRNSLNIQLINKSKNPKFPKIYKKLLKINKI